MPDNRHIRHARSVARVDFRIVRSTSQSLLFDDLTYQIRSLPCSFPRRMSGTRPKIRQAASTLRFYLKAVDSLSIVLGLMLLIVWVPEVNSRSTIVIGLVAIGLFGMVAELLGLYRNWRGIPFEREATCATLSWLATMLRPCGPRSIRPVQHGNPRPCTLALVPV